ncbi:site-specific DNA-methyltransferase [Caballeronia sp. 15715]|uniref:site-specific DNA-methyltransferase n=1 Tax=Caballeronia sp. 15715 TaxID=3391030 RepID=UPI0039E5169D
MLGVSCRRLASSQQNLGNRMAASYDHLTKEDLISLLKRRDATRKLGLVWERDEIEHERSLNDDFVTLELDLARSVGEAPFDNLLIEGDNFDALRYLHIAYRGRVKCIYIDPPYNTGNKDFVFNDTFVEKDDGYRHSKWLEFMFRRLLLAKDLLADDGVILVSIDDIENAHLTLLMEQVFPGMRVGTFVWRRRSGANDEKEWFLSADHEYVLCFAKPGFAFAGMKKDWSKATDDGDRRGAWIDGPLNQGKDIRQRTDAFYPIHDPASDTWYPCDPDSVWRFATEERSENKKLRSKDMETLIKEKRISWPDSGKTAIFKTKRELLRAIKEGTAPHNLRVYERLDEFAKDAGSSAAAKKILDNIPPVEFWVGKRIGFGKPRYKRFLTDIKKDAKPVSTWILPSSTKKADLDFIDQSDVTVLKAGFTSEGTTLLAQMVGNKDFPYPKPISLIKSLIRQVTTSDDGHIVMDFFAGSGTTGHAVLALNDEDNGNRSFILVSSTEATKAKPDQNVCRDITAKRLRSAIEGYSYRTAKGTVSVKGLRGEFAYMRTNRVPRETLAIDIRHDQIWFVLQQLHANAVSAYNEKALFQQLDGGEDAHDIIYVPQINQAVIDALRSHFDSSRKSCIVYSWQPGVIRQRFKQSQVAIEKIPDYLIERFGRVDL